MLFTMHTAIRQFVNHFRHKAQCTSNVYVSSNMRKCVPVVTFSVWSMRSNEESTASPTAAGMSGERRHNVAVITAVWQCTCMHIQG